MAKKKLPMSWTEKSALEAIKILEQLSPKERKCLVAMLCDSSWRKHVKAAVKEIKKDLKRKTR